MAVPAVRTGGEGRGDSGSGELPEGLVVGDIQVAGGIEGNSRRRVEWQADAGDDAITGDLPDAVVAGIRDVDAPRRVDRYSVRVIELGVDGEVPAICVRMPLESTRKTALWLEK
jgi:hypothetical protein